MYSQKASKQNVLKINMIFVLRLAVHKLAFPAKRKMKLQLVLWFREIPKAAGWII